MLPARGHDHYCLRCVFFPLSLTFSPPPFLRCPEFEQAILNDSRRSDALFPFSIPSFPQNLPPIRVVSVCSPPSPLFHQVVEMDVQKNQRAKSNQACSATKRKGRGGHENNNACALGIPDFFPFHPQLPYFPSHPYPSLFVAELDVVGTVLFFVTLCNFPRFFS